MRKRKLISTSTLLPALASALLVIAWHGVATAASAPTAAPRFSTAIAFDVSRPVREIAPPAALRQAAPEPADYEPYEVRPDLGLAASNTSFVGDNAVQGSATTQPALAKPTIGAPLLTFEGLSNADNASVFGFRVNPPDTVGDVGPNHYVEMVNLVFAVYDKQGNLKSGPTAIGDLWAGFAIDDCTDPSGDPVVLYDQLRDRWILSQFTTRFSAVPENDVFYNCVAISTTGDPTGTYYRYAFTTGNFFPDYPKYGVWRDSYLITTREFGPTIEYGIGVYALELNKMIVGDPNARVVRFFLDGNDPTILPLVGDGLLPADIDGKEKPESESPAPLVGTQDDGAGYGGTFDALNIWDLTVKWRKTPSGSLVLKAQLPVAKFDSIFPCGVVAVPPPPNPIPPNYFPNSRDCLAQPGAAGNQYIDILSYRQRPSWRLAYRNFDDHEALVTNQSVEARNGVAGVRWYEIRRTRGNYSLYQQGTYAPNDGVQRWMGSVAMDRQGNMALGFSVVNGESVFPGIRYTGRLSGDSKGKLNLGEAVIVDGSGIQRTLNSRWGDYTSMNVDPSDDCTFWYANEYYTLAGQISSTAGWQTRIASFQLPGCVPKKD